MRADPTLSARLAELSAHWFTTYPKPHRSGDELLPIVFADPGTNGWYYRDRKPDSVTAYIRADLHEAAVKAAVDAEREACVAICQQEAENSVNNGFPDRERGLEIAAAAIRARANGGE